jgi:hypothetical protein
VSLRFRQEIHAVLRRGDGELRRQPNSFSRFETALQPSGTAAVELSSLAATANSRIKHRLTHEDRGSFADEGRRPDGHCDPAAGGNARRCDTRGAGTRGPGSDHRNAIRTANYN